MSQSNHILARLVQRSTFCLFEKKKESGRSKKKRLRLREEGKQLHKVLDFSRERGTTRDDETAATTEGGLELVKDEGVEEGRVEAKDIDVEHLDLEGDLEEDSLEERRSGQTLFDTLLDLVVDHGHSGHQRGTQLSKVSLAVLHVEICQRPGRLFVG